MIKISSNCDYHFQHFKWVDFISINELNLTFKLSYKHCLNNTNVMNTVYFFAFDSKNKSNMSCYEETVCSNVQLSNNFFLMIYRFIFLFHAFVQSCIPFSYFLLIYWDMFRKSGIVYNHIIFCVIFLHYFTIGAKFKGRNIRTEFVFTYFISIFPLFFWEASDDNELPINLCTWRAARQKHGRIGILFFSYDNEFERIVGFKL